MGKILVLGLCGTSKMIANALSEKYDVVAFSNIDINDEDRKMAEAHKVEVKSLMREQDMTVTSRGKGAKRQRKKDRGW